MFERCLRYCRASRIATYGLGYNLTIQRSSDKHVHSHRAGTEAANLAWVVSVFVEDISGYFPHYFPNISQHELMFEHIVSRAAKQLTYIKISSYTKDVTTENIWTFELGVQKCSDVPFYVIVGFVQRDQFNQQHQNNDTFCRPTVVNAQCIIVSEQFSNAGINFTFAISKYSQAYGETVSCFKPSPKDKILHKAFITLLMVIHNLFPVIICF